MSSLIPTTPVTKKPIDEAPNAPVRPPRHAVFGGYMSLGATPSLRQPVFGSDDEELGIAPVVDAVDVVE